VTRWVTIAVGASVSLWVAACGDEPSASCDPGEVVECACIGGASGQQTCAADGTFLPCECAGAEADAGQVSDGGAADAAGCRLAEDEWCDGRDNDCDGLIDNHEACPDPTVANTEPFDGTAYFQENTSGCNYARVRRIWPTLAAPNQSNTSDCYANWFAFRPTDGRSFYYATFSGIHRNGTQVPDPVVPTPPCGDSVDRFFGFDGAGVLHYYCQHTLFRGDGVTVATNVSTYVTTLSDGRSVIIRPSLTDPEKLDFVAIGVDGAELSRLSPHRDFVGAMRPNYEAAAPVGGRAYVTYLRSFGQLDYEVVVFRLTETNEWQKVRRAVVESLGQAQLALPDGTVLVEERIPGTVDERRIVAYHRDQTIDMLWTGDTVFTWSQLLLGPP